jgi:hypothetical protein
MVGTTEVPLFNEINDLAQGEGEISPLKCKGYFEGPPHPDRRITARVSSLRGLGMWPYRLPWSYSC